MQQEYLDMHDGDEKTVSLRGSTMEIHPLGNGQKWMVRVHARAPRRPRGSGKRQDLGA